MSTTVTNKSEIPEAPFYVLTNDSFMSGWGHSQGKVNTVILPCDSLKEAQEVEHYARCHRTDQKRVRIVGNKPKLNTRTHLYSLMTREEASAWYPVKCKWCGGTGYTQTEGPNTRKLCVTCRGNGMWYEW